MILVWFRRDLRLSDNPALTQAMKLAEQTGQPLRAVYLHADLLYGNWPLGGASRWYLHHSLQSLAAGLQKLGIQLDFRASEDLQGLSDYAQQNRVSAVFWNRVVEPAYESADQAALSDLRKLGINAECFDDDCLLMPDQVHKDDGTPYRVFTPFWRRARAVIEQQPPYHERLMAAPVASRATGSASGTGVFESSLLPTGSWSTKLQDHWQPGEKSAHAMLQNFLQQPVADYDTGRDLPAEPGTSRLSPALHFGELSVVRVLYECEQLMQQETDTRVNDSISRYASELGWREFGRHVLFHFPETTDHSLNRAFDHDSLWQEDPEHRNLRSWQRGETGIPLVDAGMRELWETGWMHNRVRMVVGSFLSKNLGIHWWHGARWFWDTLVDADLASNTMGWQWVSGCGTDAAPYFRIFNPHTQAKKFDPKGSYINRWLPADNLIPELVDLKRSREKALERYQHTMSEARKQASATA